jgi:hypothetical protein
VNISAVFVDPLADRLEDRARRTRRHLHPSAARAQQHGQRRKQGWHGVGVGGGRVAGEGLDPGHRIHQLHDLPEAGQHAKHKDREDQPVEIGIGPEDRGDRRKGDIETDPDQRQHEEHGADLADGLGEMRLGLGVPSVAHGAAVLAVAGLARP